MADKTSPLPRIVFNWLRWFATLAILVATAHAADWPKIDKAELAEIKPKIDPEAGAEILLREVTMDHFTYGLSETLGNTAYFTITGTEDKYYIRAKIFSEKGVKHFSLFRLVYDSAAKATGIAARTIKPDGTIVELKPDDIKERDTTAKSGRRMKMKTFAFPALEPGAIVEYRYTVTSPKIDYTARMYFQDNLPTRLVRYKVGLIKNIPASSSRAYELRSIAYNCPPQKLVPKNGFLIFEQSNLPAIKAEPYQPPIFTTHSSMIVFIEHADDDSAGTFWGKFSKKQHKILDAWSKTDPSVSTALAKIVTPSDTEEEKLRKIYDWCRTNILNRDRGTTHLSKEERQKLKRNENAADVLSAKIGYARDINFLFAALAKAAGFEVRLVSCNDRTAIPFNVKITQPAYIFPDRAIAVRLGTDWRYFNPGASYLPFGTLSENNSDTALLISDPAGLEQPINTPIVPAEANTHERKATFHLSANGTLEGDVIETYTGQIEAKIKNMLDDLSAEKRAKFITDEIRRKLRQAQITQLDIQNADNPVGQLKVSYHLKVPGYASKTGTRLFVQPAVFQKGKPAMLKDTERKAPLVFPFRYVEKDNIRITPPEGYTLESGSAPQDIDAPGLGHYGVTIFANSATHEITYKRECSLTNVSFKATSYAPIKSVFDQVRLQDEHTLTLKRDENTPDTEAAAPADNTEKETPAKSGGKKNEDTEDEEEPMDN